MNLFRNPYLVSVQEKCCCCKAGDDAKNRHRGCGCFFFSHDISNGDFCGVLGLKRLPVFIEDVYKAVADAKGFTYTISQWGTIADINGIANTETEFWMTAYENNGETPVYSVADPVIEGAVITLEYQSFDENWKPIDTKYTAKITVADIMSEEEAAASPMPVLGIIAGLAAAALFLNRD